MLQLLNRLKHFFIGNISIITGIIAIINLLYCIFSSPDYKQIADTYTEQVTAAFIGLETKQEETTDVFGRININTVFVQNWTYVYDNIDYDIQVNQASSTKTYAVGDTDIINVNPKEPADAMFVNRLLPDASIIIVIISTFLFIISYTFENKIHNHCSTYNKLDKEAQERYEFYKKITEKIENGEI